jgi:hypothetical protein
MDLIKHQGNVLKQVGSLQAIPGVSDAINSFVDNTTGEKDKKIKALEAEVAAGRKTKEQAEMEAKNTGMKKGGKVSSASKRADGCCIRGKTRA